MDSPEPLDSLAPYTDASRARLAMSREASDLADSARTLVPIYPGELRRTGGSSTAGGMIEDVARLRARADYVLTLAVVYERLAGTSWEQIGEALGVTRQSAHQRYADAERRFREALAEPEATSDGGEPYVRLDAAAYEPDEWAGRLDAWVIRHRERWDAGQGPEPVSGGLARMDPQTELFALADRRRRLFAQHFVVPREELIAIAERELQLWQQMAAAESGRVRPAAEGAEMTRRTLAGLRAANAGPSGADAAPGPRARKG
jgi:hypothetical protein